MYILYISFLNKYPSNFALPSPIKRSMLSMQFAVRFSRFLRAYKTVLILLASTTEHGTECLSHCCTESRSDWQSHINFNLIQLALSSEICRLRHLLSLIAKQRGCREYKHIASQTGNARGGGKKEE